MMLCLMVFPALASAESMQLNSAESLAEQSETQVKRAKYTLKDLESLEGADVVFVSKMMLSMAKGVVPSTPMGNAGNMKDLMKELTGVHVISVENRSSVKKGLQILAEVVASEKLEVLMQMKESDGDDVTFYYKAAKNNEDAELILVTNESGDELTVIRLRGNVDVAKLQQLTK